MLLHCMCDWYGHAHSCSLAASSSAVPVTQPAVGIDVDRVVEAVLNYTKTRIEATRIPSDDEMEEEITPGDEGMPEEEAPEKKKVLPIQLTMTKQVWLAIKLFSADDKNIVKLLLV